jgi:hypothetical protein
LQIKIEKEGLNEFLGYNESFKIDIDETLKTEQQETEDINWLLKLESNHDILEKYICNLKKI